jgi:hypothetical protein
MSTRMRGVLREIRSDLEGLAAEMLGLGFDADEVLEELLVEALDRVEIAAATIDAALPLDRIPAPRLAAVLEEIDGPVLEWLLKRILTAAIRRRRRPARGVVSLADVRAAIAAQEGGQTTAPLR